MCKSLQRMNYYFLRLILKNVCNDKINKIMKKNLQKTVQCKNFKIDTIFGNKTITIFTSTYIFVCNNVRLTLILQHCLYLVEVI
jgi:hypothetical protein